MSRAWTQINIIPLPEAFFRLTSVRCIWTVQRSSSAASGQRASAFALAAMFAASQVSMGPGKPKISLR